MNKDYKEFIELLNSHSVDYLISGGWALAYHAEPRWTGDLDIVVRCTPVNAEKLESVLRAFGFNTHPLITKVDLLQRERFIQMGRKPVRIDLQIDLFPGSFEEAWQKKHEISLGKLPMRFLDRDALIDCKRAAGRLKDLADIENLERTRPKTERSRDRHEDSLEKVWRDDLGDLDYDRDDGPEFER